MVWHKSTTLESEPNSTDTINPILASPFMASFTNHSSTVPFSSGGDNPTSGAPPVATDNTISDHQNQIQSQNQTAVRNPKKRSRASRRAPTTVLTTDTTNFRAMVQEFTGIPAQPFTSSPFPRSRLDLFGTPSSLRSSPLDTIQPPYLLRPFAQKVQSPTPFLSSASSSSLLSSSSNNNIITSGSSTTSACNLTPSINYQLPTESSNLSNIFPLATSAMVGSKSRVPLEIPSDDHPHIKFGGLNDFSLGHGHVNTTISGLPNLISSDQMALRDDNNATNWSKSPSNNGDPPQMTPVNGNYNLSRNATSGKLIFSASSSTNFHGEKGSDNVAPRGDGMVESWICSSD
ncbi:VQ motif-containing protein motif-containing protein [Forsythia ovata]|uniref:VQ motif-containing protein motif-containing protein n=1 Tax=Forsythia ovata TaxID=205694 RepID=A0ABD1U959_9LAMI